MLLPDPPRIDARRRVGSRIVALLVATSTLAAAKSSVVNWVEVGNRAMDQGDLHRAIIAYSRAVEAIPEDPAAWYDRARAYATMGKTVEAIADARTSIAVRRDFDEGFALLARLEHERGDDVSALGYADRAVALKPAVVDYRLRRASVLRALGRADAAAADYEAAIAVNPALPDALRGLAEVQLDRHRDAEAMRTLQRYAAVSPHDADANAAYAALLVEAHRYGEALDWSRTHPSSSAEMKTASAAALMNLGQTADAEAMLGPPSPDEAPSLMRLRGEIAFRDHRCAAAADAFDRAAAADAHDAELFRDDGVADLCAGRNVAAQTALSRALSLDARDGLSLRYRADARRALGDLAGAIADGRRALALTGPAAHPLMLLGIDEYTTGDRRQGRSDYALGCSLLPPSEVAERAVCRAQLHHMSSSPAR